MAKTYKLNILGTIIDIPEYVVSKYSDEQLKAVLETYLTENPISTLDEATIQSVLDNTLTSYVKTEDALNETDVLSCIENSVQSKKNIRTSNDTKFTQFVMPDSDFLQLPINFITDGNRFYTDFDVSNFKNNGGTIYYISPTGNNGNDGLSAEKPSNALSTIYSKLVDGDTVVLLDGVYKYDRWIGNSYKYFEKSINIVAQNNGKAIVKCGADYTYEKYETIYRTPIDCTLMTVLQNYCDKYIMLDTVSTIEDCIATNGSFINVDGYLYINTVGNNIPSNSNMFVIMKSSIALIHTLCSTQNVQLYIEGITFLGGTPSTIYFSNSASYTEPRICAKKCKFLYGNDETVTNDGVRILGSTAYFQDCEASFSDKDGFNYHALNNRACKMIEVNCTAHNNGYTFVDKIDNGTMNGSTMHDGSIGIRYGCTYYENYGCNVADVHENTKSINIECISYDSNYDGTESPSSNSCFSAQQSGTTMWLYNCKAFGTDYDIYCGVSTAKMYLYNTEYETIDKRSTGLIYVDDVEYIKN